MTNTTTDSNSRCRCGAFSISEALNGRSVRDFSGHNHTAHQCPWYAQTMAPDVARLFGAAPKEAR